MDTRNKDGSLTVNGAMYNAPISNTGPNAIFGIINNYPPARVPVKDPLADIPPEVDERMPKPSDWELMIFLMYKQCDSESVSLFLRKQQERLVQEQKLQEQERQQERQQERRMREQLDQDRRQFTEAALKMDRERAALRAEQEAFEEKKRSLQTQAPLFSLSETYQPWQQAGSAQSTPTLAASTNSVNDLQDFEFCCALPPSSNSKLSNNHMPSRADKSRERSSPIDKMPTTLGKKAAIASATQEEPEKSKRIRVSSRSSKIPVVATTRRRRE